MIPPIPKARNLQTVLHSSGWVVWSGTKHPEEAVMLLEYLSGPIGRGLVGGDGLGVAGITQNGL